MDSSLGNINKVLPDDLLENILLRLSGDDLCKSAVLVCKRWNSIIENQSFWIFKCLTRQKLNRSLINLLYERGVETEAKRIYFSDLFTRNLLKNPCGDEAFDYWKLLSHEEQNKINSSNKMTPNDIENIIKNYKRNHILTRHQNRWEREWQNCLSSTWAIENMQTGVHEYLRDKNGQVLLCFASAMNPGKPISLIDSIIIKII